MSEQKQQTEAFEARAVQWWEWLNTKRRRGARADLRRCCTTVDVRLVPAFYELRRAIPREISSERLALIASVLSHVKHNSTTHHFAQQLAGAGGITMHKQRFQQLQTIADDDADDLIAGLRRAVRLMNGTANIPNLVTAMRWWNDYTRMQWAHRYYMYAGSSDSAAA